jgi:CheY-like chemotaxis protein
VPQTLLLADDSVTIQRVIELTFADEDIHVVAVSDGDQAIARLDAVPPDIVLVDVGMPGKNGYDVAAYVKQSPRLSHIPVVLLTGAFEPVDEQKAAGAGCDGVLAKPFEPQQVIGRVKELLSKPARPIGSLDGVIGGQPDAGHTDESDGTIDDYFDQLDAAFSNLTGKPGQTPASRPTEIDWFGLKPMESGAASPELSLGAAEPRPIWAAPAHPTGVMPPPAEPVAPTTEAAASSTMAPDPTQLPLPPLADAFATLLEAERSEPGTPVSWPGSAPIAVTDDLIAQVSRRVIEQLTDRVVRETVASIAERLIREEIERIKQSIE